MTLTPIAFMQRHHCSSRTKRITASLEPFVSKWGVDCSLKRGADAAKLLVIHHSDPSDTPGARESRRRLRAAARELGCPVWKIPQFWLQDGDAESALAKRDRLPEPAPAVYNGYILTTPDYAELYEACARRNAFLLNDPADYRQAHRFDEIYDRIADLTPRTEAARSQAELATGLWWKSMSRRPRV